MKIKYLVISLVLIIIIVAVAIYVSNDQKIVLPLDRLNKLDADIVYELNTDNWYSKIVVDYDPEKYSDTIYYTMEYYYLEYIGDNEIFKEDKPFKYKLSLFVQSISGESSSVTKNPIPGSSTPGYVLDMYPDKATLEIDIDGQVETYELLRQE